MTSPDTIIYDLGDPATISLAVAVDGAPVDPSSVELTVRAPDDTDSTPAVTRVGTGSYRAVITPAAPGDYRYRWVTTGTGAGAEEGVFTVRPAFTGITAARARARKRLAGMVAATERPALADDVLDDLLDQYRTADQYGSLVTDPGYIPTWNLNAAAAEGWRRKAALVAGDFTFTADDASYSKGEVLANMERMVALYAAKDVGVASFGTAERPYVTDRLMPNG